MPSERWPVPYTTLRPERVGQAVKAWRPRAKYGVISRDFFLEFTRFFPGKHLIHFLVLKMKDFRNFVIRNYILVFDAEQFYLKFQVTSFKNKELTVNPNPKPEKKIGFSKTLYPIP